MYLQDVFGVTVSHFNFLRDNNLDIANIHRIDAHGTNINAQSLVSY